MSQPLLSILLLSVPSRIRNVAPDLLMTLDAQAVPFKGDIEIILLYDNKSLSVGVKRQALLHLATGKYLTFVDDDDQVADDYVGKIHEAITANPGVDVITFIQELHWGHRYPVACTYSIKNDMETKGPGWYKAWPSHTMVWRTKIARMASFPDLNFREDVGWSKLVAKHATTEYHIPETLYFYYYDKSFSETRVQP